MKFALNILFCFNLLLISAAGFTQTNVLGTIINIRQGKSVELNALSLNAHSFQWFKNGQIIPNAITSKYVITEAGDYTVLSFNNLNCSSSLSEKVSIIVWPSIEKFADLKIVKTADNKSIKINETFSYTISIENMGPDDANNVLVKDSLPRNLELVDFEYNPKAITKYNPQLHAATWEIPVLRKDEKIDLKISTKAISPGIINNVATVNALETDTNITNNTANAIKEVYGLNFPNVFTPNHDNINDFYKISGLEFYPENEFTVVNRWGNHVYERKSYKNDWTGEGLSEGTYFYVLKIKSPDDKWEVFKGFITLIRTKK